MNNLDWEHNPGTITKNNRRWQWLTELGPYTLNLDIVPLPKQDQQRQIGIASFVVMEQNQNFLNYVADLLAESIIKNLDDHKKAILLTAEAKGSHFTPWVWKNININYPQRLHDRIITLRKGRPKVYMPNPTAITYQSITSTKPQRLNLPPKDKRLLKSLDLGNYQLVFVDDFIGKGGTVVGVHKLFKKLGFSPPRLASVIGSDGNLFKKTFKNNQIKIKLIPRPLLLKLPTFTRSSQNKNWQIKQH